jgi:cell shape-determining protein MreC
MENNLDINLLVQNFSEKLSQFTTDLVVKDTIIQQLNKQVLELSEKLNEINLTKSEKDTDKKDVK